MSAGIVLRRIADTPIAIIDFETTGLTPGYDRVVEASVVRIDPGQAPRLVYDTLVNPLRPMAGTEIHGITDADVAQAPRFAEIAGDLLAATQGCVVAAYNVYFDMRFLGFELANAGVQHQPPHFCLMYMRPMLALGPRCKLSAACAAHGVEYAPSHISAHDALAAGRLFEFYRQEIERKRVQTFAELAQLRSYKFSSSFGNAPFPSPTALGLRPTERSLSRSGHAPDPTRQAVASYWDALKSVIGDLEITDDELAFIQEEQQRGGLQPEQIRVLHARVFTSVVAQFTADQWLDDQEARRLRKLYVCLAKLGWAPGE